MKVARQYNPQSAGPFVDPLCVNRRLCQFLGWGWKCQAFFTSCVVFGKMFGSTLRPLDVNRSRCAIPIPSENGRESNKNNNFIDGDSWWFLFLVVHGSECSNVGTGWIGWQLQDPTDIGDQICCHGSFLVSPEPPRKWTNAPKKEGDHFKRKWIIFQPLIFMGIWEFSGEYTPWN